MFPTPLAILLYLAPESPWWLVRKNRFEDAKRCILQLVSPCDIPFDADAQVALLKATNDLEK